MATLDPGYKPLICMSRFLIEAGSNVDIDYVEVSASLIIIGWISLGQCNAPHWRGEGLLHLQGKGGRVERLAAGFTFDNKLFVEVIRQASGDYLADRSTSIRRTRKDMECPSRSRNGAKQDCIDIAIGRRVLWRNQTSMAA